MNTKNYIVIAGLATILLAGAFGVASAVYIANVQMPMVLQVGASGNVLMRGTVDAIGANSLTVKSWGGDWVVNIPLSASLMPYGSMSQFSVGDFIGVQGVVNQSGSWMIDAKLVRDWTPNHVVSTSAPVINSVSGPSSLSVNQTGTWAINATSSLNQNLTYSVAWGDNFYPPMMSNGAAQSPVYVQTATFTHVYYATGNYNPTFYVKDNSGNVASTSLNVNVTGVVTTNSPSINYLQPSSGPVGTMVTIYGSNFAATENKVVFGNLGSENSPAYYKSSSNGTTLTFIVPYSNYYSCWNSTPACLLPARMTLPGAYDVSVINSNGTSNQVTFTVTSQNTCIPNWQCDWGPCVNAYQSMTAVDTNNCSQPKTPSNIMCPMTARVCPI